MTKLLLRYVNEYRDVHGKVRRYFRRRGFKKVPLPGLPGSEEFMAAYKREGAAMTKRDNVHRMADANKAFAHFAW